ncbi:hypothetical protein HDU98_006995 [Podochytrium sp. JEL0797]|nr:hypothetical protein HDU98_006995 [Podochytrium sp. JEL0797]
MTTSVTNTNACLGLAPSLAVCAKPNLDGSILPSAICCNVIFEYNKAGCFCNPITSVLLGSQQASMLAYVARPVCAVASWKPWTWVVPCHQFEGHTYNNGVCPSNDIEMDAARFVTAGSYQAALSAQVYAPRYGSGCFNFTSLLEKVTPFMDPAYTISGTYGLGVYTTPKMAIEYYAILNAQINNNYAVSTAGPSKLKIAGFLPDGALVLGSLSSYSFYNEMLTSPPAYVEVAHSFDGCTTSNIFSALLPSGSVLNPNLGKYGSTMAYIAAITTLGQNSTTWGPENTCKFHTTYCTGTNAQFDTEQECVDFLYSLPLYSPVCGFGHMLSGNSRVCRSKHQYMAPLSPEIHCAHLSRKNEHCSDDNCGPGGDASQTEKYFNQFKTQVDDIMAVQDGIGSNWTLPKVC